MLVSSFARGSRFAALALLAAALAGGACADDDTVPIDGEDLEPACMLLIDTEGHWDDGTHTVIYDAFVSEAGAVACLCLREEEFHSKARRNELADLVLAECERLSALFEFDWDECQEDYDNGVWLPFVYWSGEGTPHAFQVPPSLPCH